VILLALESIRGLLLVQDLFFESVWFSSVVYQTRIISVHSGYWMQSIWYIVYVN